MSSFQIGKVAIIGGGFAGLACARLLAPRCHQITLYDLSSKAGVDNASAISCGFINPYSTKGKLIWRGQEGFQKAIDSISSCQHLTESKLLTHQKAVRLNFTDNEMELWSQAAEANNELYQLLSLDELSNILGPEYFQGIMSNGRPAIVGGVLLRLSNSANSPEYLSAMWKNIQNMAKCSTWCQREIQSRDLQDLARDNDIVIVAAGPGLQRLWESAADNEEKSDVEIAKNPNLPFKHVAGQYVSILQENLPAALKVPLAGGEFMIPHPADNSRIIFGSTYEHMNEEILQQWVPNPDSAMKHLSERLTMHNLYPGSLQSFDCLDVDTCKGGVRVVPNRCGMGRIPKIARHKQLDNVWMLGGLASKGLVHHVVVAEELIRAIDRNDEKALPIEMRIKE